MVSQKGREMKKLTKQFKGILLVMLCVILMVPHVNANAATQKQKAMSAYKKMLSASRVYVLPNNTKYYDDYHYRTLIYHGSLSKNVYFGLAYINNDGIPELVLRAKCNGVSLYSVWTYKNGKAVRVAYGNGGSVFKGYFNKTGIYLERAFSDGTPFTDSYYRLSGTTVTRVISKFDYGYGGGADYSIGNRSCSASAFAAKRKSITKGYAMKKVSYVKNTAASRKAKLK